MSIEATEISAYQAPPPRKTEPEKSDESFDQHLAEAIDEPAPAKQDDTPGPGYGTGGNRRCA